MTRPDNEPLAPKLPPGYVNRPRLSARLDALQDRALIYIRGVAGAGKTTLLSAWVRERPYEDLVWVTLDRTVRTPSDFWRTLASVLPADDRPLSLASASFASWLRQRPRPVTVVIDDAHFAHPALADELIQVSQELHRGRLILGTRAFESPSDALAVVQTATATINVTELAYTPEELADLLTASSSVGGGTDVVPDAVLSATGGHALLTRLALSSPLLRTPEGMGRAVSQWAAQLLPNHLRRFAFQVALEGGVTVERAREVSGDEQAATWLGELARDGIGGVDEAGVFRFHSLMGSALAAHARAIGLGQTGDAAAGRPHVAPKWDWPHFQDATAAETSDLSMMLAELPPSNGTAQELVAASAAVSQSRREPVPSIGLTNAVTRALEHLARQPQVSGTEEQLYRELAVQALLWSARRHDEGGDRAPRLLALANDLDVNSQTGVWPSAYWGLLYSSVMLTLAARLDEAEDVLSALDSDRDSARVMRRVIQRAFIYAMRGEVGAAERLLSDAGEPHTESAEWQGKLAITRAAIELERGDPRAAQETLASIELDLPQIQEWPYALVVTARTHLATDPVAGIEAIDRVLRTTSRRPITKGVRDLLDSALGDLALAAGDIQRAKRLVARRGEDDIALRLTAARVALIVGDREAVKDLRSLTEKDGVWPRLRAQALLLLTVHGHRSGDALGAQQALRRALAITGGQGIRLIHSLIPFTELQDIADAAGVELPANVNRANPLEHHLAPVALTTRERNLLDSLSSPALLREIAAAEYVSLSTVKSQAASLYRKLGASSRDDAVAIARRRGIL